MRRITDNRGISFIQVIMASTAIAGLALVGLRLAQGQRKLVESVYSNRLSHYLFQEITFLLRRESVCTSTFTGLNPSNATVGKLIENIETRQGRIDHEFFPIKNGPNSQEGHYFDGRVSLLSYALTDAYEGANLSKGLTSLKVELELENEIVEKLYPIKFTKDEEGRIGNCQLLEAGKFTGSGKWQQGPNGLQLIGPNVVIGRAYTKKQKMISSGEIRINPKSTLPTCNESLEGVLLHEQGGLLKVCHKQMWEPFGEQRIKFELPTSYILNLTKLGSDAKFTKKHRLCYIKKLKKNSISDGCQLRRISRGYNSEYELKIFTSSEVTNSECEVNCVD